MNTKNLILKLSKQISSSDYTNNSDSLINKPDYPECRSLLSEISPSFFLYRNPLMQTLYTLKKEVYKNCVKWTYSFFSDNTLVDSFTFYSLDDNFILSPVCSDKIKSDSDVIQVAQLLTYNIESHISASVESDIFELKKIHDSFHLYYHSYSNIYFLLTKTSESFDVPPSELTEKESSFRKDDVYDLSFFHRGTKYTMCHFVTKGYLKNKLADRYQDIIVLYDEKEILSVAQTQIKNFFNNTEYRFKDTPESKEREKIIQQSYLMATSKKTELKNNLFSDLLRREREDIYKKTFLCFTKVNDFLFIHFSNYPSDNTVYCLHYIPDGDFNEGRVWSFDIVGCGEKIEVGKYVGKNDTHNLIDQSFDKKVWTSTIDIQRHAECLIALIYKSNET